MTPVKAASIREPDEYAIAPSIPNLPVAKLYSRDFLILTTLNIPPIPLLNDISKKSTSLCYMQSADPHLYNALLHH